MQTLPPINTSRAGCFEPPPAASCRCCGIEPKTAGHTTCCSLETLGLNTRHRQKTPPPPTPAKKNNPCAHAHGSAAHSVLQLEVPRAIRLPFQADDPMVGVDRRTPARHI